MAADRIATAPERWSTRAPREPDLAASTSVGRTYSTGSSRYTVPSKDST